MTNNKLTGLGANHPANGPLSIARLHQLRDGFQRALQYSNGGNAAYINTDVLKVIDEVIEWRNQASEEIEHICCKKSGKS